MGGIPIATALSLKTGIPVVFVRKKAKEYGASIHHVLCVIEREAVARENLKKKGLELTSLLFRMEDLLNN
jgi:orotate phosphoribosyltransferase